MTKKAKTIEIIVNPDDNDALASNKECAEHWFSQSADIDPDAVAAAADADPNSLVYVCKCGVAKKSHPKIYTNPMDVFLKRKSESVDVSGTKYYNLHFVSPTSCDVERLFSVSRNILRFNRMAMSPALFEYVIFLKMNHQLWDAGTVSRLIKNRGDQIQKINQDADDFEDPNSVLTRVVIAN